MSKRRLLLCAALEHTLLPLGEAAEPSSARQRFRALASQPEISIVYVSSRSLTDILVACTVFQLPLPDFLISEGGLIVHERILGSYSFCREWNDDLSRDYAGCDSGCMQDLFADLTALRQSPSSSKSQLKYSYAYPLSFLTTTIDLDMQQRLEGKGIRAKFVSRINGARREGKIDVLPARTSRLNAVEFVRRRLGYEYDETLYAGSGDCGDDVAALTGPIPSVLVANAGDDVREIAREIAARNGAGSRFYCAADSADGDPDGNFAAGVIRGVLAHHPDFRSLGIG